MTGDLAKSSTIHSRQQDCAGEWATLLYIPCSAQTPDVKRTSDALAKHI